MPSTTQETPQATEINPETAKEEELIAEILKQLKLEPWSEEGRRQAELIRIGLKKIKEANIGKIIVNVCNEQKGVLEHHGNNYFCLHILIDHVLSCWEHVSLL